MELQESAKQSARNFYKMERSQRHLSTDYEWETLPSIDKSLLFEASRELLDSPPSQHAEKHRNDSKSPIDPGAVPKQRPADDPFLPQATPQVPFTGQDAKQTPPPDRQLAASIPPSLVALQLQKESQELEIKKLELQLQLAKLQGGQIAAPTSTESSPGKSLGDLKAPQKTLNPQPWLHIYAPGEPKLYNDLSMPEFCAGHLVIIHQSASKPHYAALLNHFHQLMVFASAYQWSAVRSSHYKVLRFFEFGLVKWGDSFHHLKVQFLTPSSLLSEIAPRKTAKLRLLPHLNQRFRVTKFATNGPGTTIVCPLTALSNTFASLANAPITKPSHAPSGSFPSQLAAQNHRPRHDYLIPHVQP